MSSAKDHDSAVTALALGELPPDEAARVEAALSPADQARLRETRAAASMLRTALRHAPPLSLSVQQRAKIEAQLGPVSAPVVPPRVPRSPRRRRMMWGGASIAAVAAGVATFSSGSYDVTVPESVVVARESDEETQRSGPVPVSVSDGNEYVFGLEEGVRGEVRKRRPRSASGAKSANAVDTATPPTGGTDVDQFAMNTLSSRDKNAGYNRVSARRGPRVRRKTPVKPRYADVPERGFSLVADAPLATVAIDVDTAAYSNVRRYLHSGRLPPREAVRIEEMINYFTYDLPAPSDEHSVAIVADVTDAPWNPDHLLARVALTAKRSERRKPANLVFLVDVSGSMASKNKLPLLKKALSGLVARLGQHDRVAIVTYALRAKQVLAPTSDRRRITAAIRSMRPAGRTNGGAGLDLAYRLAQDGLVAGGINRVIVATDGVFNAGVTDDDTLVRSIRRYAGQNIFLSVLGFGADIQDARLERLADQGNGHYAFIDGAPEAERVLSQQLESTLEVVAKDVKLQVELNPARVSRYRLIGYDNRRIANRDFSDDRTDGGEMGAGQSMTALYELVPQPSSERALKYQPSAPGPDSANDLFTVHVRYKDADGHRSRHIERPVHSWRGHFEDGRDDLRFAAAVAGFGMILRDSPHRGAANYDLVARLGRTSLGRDRGGRRAEFVRLVETAGRLARQRRKP